jgi:hypothetical protein
VFVAFSVEFLQVAQSIDAAGDTIWVSQAHTETGAGNLAPAIAGTDTAVEAILCGNDGAEPPTTLATTAAINTAGNLSWGAAAYYYGLVCTTTTGGSHQLNNTNTRQQRMEQCTFRINASSNLYSVIFNSSGSGGGRIALRDCRYKFGHAGQGWAIGGYVHEINGSFEGGTTAPTTLIKSTGVGTTLVEGTDFSNLGTGFNVTVPPVAGQHLTLRRVKFAASWAGALISAALTTPVRVSMYNYMIGSTVYGLWIEDFAGVIKSETVIVMDNGASDGVTAFSWKMTSNANAEPLLTHLISDEMVIWSDTVGGSPAISRTITVNILHDSATNLTDNEVWLEVHYLGSSSSALGSYANDRKADTLATAADQTASSEGWTTTGLSNPNKQKLSATITPGQKGFYICKVVLAKPSKTIYVDPAPVLS